MEADLFAYFKTTEGKHQTWHHNESNLRAKLETYARFRGAVLVPRLDCEGDCLVAQARYPAPRRRVEPGALPSCGGDVDMARVLPRDDAENLLFGGMAAARSACGIFATRACNRTNHRTAACNPFAFEAEDFVRRAVPHNRGCVRARPLRPASCPLLKS
ncbi:hypothetical protein JL722_4594 [Aureococcus anophagefferens]|nr:hypothetical protein JL722_4594 [Aureococcus anophagefferens]